MTDARPAVAVPGPDVRSPGAAAWLPLLTLAAGLGAVGLVAWRRRQQSES